MKRLGAMVLIGLGVLLVALGLLFIVGAAGKASRFAVAAAGLAVGAIAIVAGVVVHRRADRETPDRIASEILELARRKNGEVSWADVAATLGQRVSLAEPVIDELVRRGTCKRTDREGQRFLVFDGLQPRLIIRRCKYCKTEAPIGDAREQCANCGGPLETVREARGASAGDLYGMDG